MMYIIAFIYFILVKLELWSILKYSLLFSIVVFKIFQVKKRNFQLGNDIDYLLFLFPWIMILKATGNIRYFILLPIICLYFLYQKLVYRQLNKPWFWLLAVLNFADFAFFQDYTGLKVIQMLFLFVILIDNITPRGLRWFSLSWILSYLSIIHHAKDRFMNDILWIDPVYLGLGTAIVYFIWHQATADASKFRNKERLFDKLKLLGIFVLIAVATSRTIMLGVISSILYTSIEQRRIRSVFLLIVLAIALVSFGLLENTKYSVFLDNDISLTKRTSGRLDMYLVYYSFLTNANWLEVLFGVDYSGYLVWFQDWSRVNEYIKDSSLAGDLLSIHSQYITWLVRYGLILGSVTILLFFWEWRRFGGNLTRTMKILLIIFASTTLISNPLVSIILAIIYRSDVKFSR